MGEDFQAQGGGLAFFCESIPDKVKWLRKAIVAILSPVLLFPLQLTCYSLAT